MSTFIVFRDFNDIAICGEVHLKRGEEFPSIITEEREFICNHEKQFLVAVYSQNQVDHFARNDDGQGLLRGDLTYLIAHKSFTEEQEKIIRKQWFKYILPFKDTLLFNNLFYELSIDILKKILSSLKIEVENNV